MSVAVVASGLVVASCGVSGEGTTTLEAGGYGAASLQRAGQATSRIDTMKIAMSAGYGRGAPITEMRGEVDRPARRMHMASTGSGPIGAGDVEVVVDGDTAYMKSKLYAQMSGGKPWVKISAGGLGAATANVAAGSDPKAFLDFLQGISGKVETVGQEDVRGVPTTHLKAQADLSKALDRLPKGSKDEFGAMLGLFDDAFSDIPVEVWIDGDDLVRKVQLSIDMGKAFGALGSDDEDMPKGMGSMVMVETIEMYDFNQPVSIEVPPASEVGTIDVSKIEDQFGGSSDEGEGHAGGPDDAGEGKTTTTEASGHDTPSFQPGQGETTTTAVTHDDDPVTASGPASGN